MGCKCNEFMLKMMKFISESDLFGEIVWEFKNDEVSFHIICNDLFWSSTADAEEIKEEDIELLKSSINDAGFEDGLLLYCARKRGMRPQGAMYKHLNKKNYKFFDECGSRRATGDGNPVKPKE